MAISIDWPTGVITVQQSDTDILTLVSGTVYSMDTQAFRLELKDLEDSDEGMMWLDTHFHKTTTTISGTTYVRFIEIINGYSITFLPDTLWTVIMDGASNNNFHDAAAGILNQNSVQVIPANSAGNTITETGTSGLTASEAAQLDNLHKIGVNKVVTDPVTGIITIYEDDGTTPHLSGSIYEDKDAVQPYRGTGLERREKLS